MSRNRNGAWRRSGSAVECRTLDRGNTVTSPLHIGAVDGDSSWRCYDKTKSLYLYFAKKRDLFYYLFFYNLFGGYRVGVRVRVRVGVIYLRKSFSVSLRPQHHSMLRATQICLKFILVEGLWVDSKIPNVQIPRPNGFF